MPGSLEVKCSTASAKVGILLGFLNPSKSGEKSVSGSKERLIAVDDADHSLSYEIVESNIGFNSYVATFRIVPRGDIDVPGQPGAIRYCATPPTDPADETTIRWTKEVLLEIDPIKHRLSYVIIDNNLGFKSYVAVMQLVPVNGEDGSTGCKIKW
ncbi:lachrymatory-factor synthase-like [Pyrus ussuriensis x Pyrus communis]|uniref:Lachrymatory-factor synthase-like n=1 Tax=Pyrus ussuriensis x Pyrus communis TaxID=2448454 RepID=A0A5N5HS35_9ROSA|nr:lachrymatory-factor synthase-like [Pyrus ussuriensis x Pyrus communis]